MKKSTTRSGLLATTTLCGAVLTLALPALLPQAAMAQDAPAATPDTSTQPTAKTNDTPTEVVVTGSILRRKNLNSDAPLTIMSADDLDKRGMTTVESAIQSLAANNGGNLPNSFTANGAFAAGASGASLRGLTTNSTLVLFDGMRAAYYPLADDGTRSFVDLNTIPEAIVDHIEVLQDGASATYGADAIAGVINVITKKQFKGLTMTADAGVAEQGGAGTSHASVTWGKGDLGTDGWNFYASAEYQRDDALYNRDRGSLYNTADLSGLCGTSVVDGSQTCRENSIVNGIQADGSFLGVGTTTVPVVREVDPATGKPLVLDPVAKTTADWQLLNPTAGCGSLKSVTVTPDQAAAGGATGVANGPVTLCQEDRIHDFGTISPLDKRISLSAHLTKQWSNGTQAWIEGNYYTNEVFYSGTPSAVTNPTVPGAIDAPVSVSPLLLPNWVCPERVNCATAADHTLNPNNPFASATTPEDAQIQYRFADIPQTNDDKEETFRVAFGVKGNVWSGWNYDINGVAMENDLTLTTNGYQNVQHLLDVIADGTYNFVDPSQNSAAIRAYVAPTSVVKAKSQEVELKGDLSKGLWDLPGGALQLGLGGEIRYEMVNDPSANPDEANPTDRYAVINAFGTKGQRTTASAFFELDAPIFTQLDLNASGRYDSYSTGQSAFSPKIGFRYKPVEQLTFRGTFSKGFRIPSFGEANSLPTTGYVTVSVPSAYAAAFAAAHGGDGYGAPYSLGETTIGTAGLKPEKSDNFTFGAVYEPNRMFSFTADYYYIKKTDVIAGADPTAAIDAYYAGTAVPAGFKVVAGTPDPNHPDAQPVLGFVEYGFANLNKSETDGFDFSATGRFTLPHNIHWISTLSATYVDKYNVYFPQADGSVKVEKYAGTIAPFAITSASGTPKIRGNWMNTFDFGNTTITTTTYYTSGYYETAQDNDDASVNIGDCADSSTAAFYMDGATPVVCKVKAFIDTDVNVNYKVNAHYSMFLDVSNAFGAKAPYDPATYGGYNYNPAWANAGIIGRYWKIGVKATF